MRKSIAIATLGFAALLGLIIVWPNSEEVATARSSGTPNSTQRVASPTRQHAAPTAQARPTRVAQPPPAEPGERLRGPSIKTTNEGDEKSTSIAVRSNRLAEKQWESFVQAAQPTAEQQRAILLILSDAQKIVDRETPPTNDETMNMEISEQIEIRRSFQKAIDDEVNDRVRKVLSDEQFEAFTGWIPRPNRFIYGRPVQEP